MGKQQVLQVTKSNFPRALEQIRGYIDQSQYISISTKRTGGFRRPWHRLLPIDAPEVAYLKSKAAAESYEIFQFAVCPFRIDGSRVIAFPYNFHLFPRDELNIGMPSYRFSCQTSFLSNMVREGFDFNACIYDGISYLSRAQECKAKVRTSMAFINPVPTNFDLSTADRFLRERTISKVKRWKDACKEPCKVGEDALLTSLRKLILGSELYGSRPSLTLDVCSSRQAHLIAQALSETFEDVVPIIIPERDGKAGVVRAVLTNSEEDKKILLDELQNQEKEHDRKFRGFREVVDLISNSGKPVVTYGCLNEFTFIHSKFLAPLPPTMTDFISSVMMAFSNTIDVSHLLKEIGPLRKANNLPEAITCLRRQFRVPMDVITPQVEESCENLGRDVIRITHVFAKLCSILKTDHHEDGQLVTSFGSCKNTFLPCSTSIRELEEEDVGLWLDNASNISTDHVVFVWGFSKGISAAALRALLCSSDAPFFKDSKVKLIDKNCAVVIFAQPDLANAFLTDMEGGNNLSPLTNLICNGLKAASYGVYKRICMTGLCEADLADLFDTYSIENLYDSTVYLTKEKLNLSWTGDLIASLSEI